MLRSLGSVSLVLTMTASAWAQTLAQPPTPAPAPEPHWPPAQNLRGLPVCRPGTPFPAPGAPYPCRWPPPPGGPELGFAVGIGLGHVRSDSFTTGSIFQFDVQLDTYLTRAFGVGLRYR